MIDEHRTEQVYVHYILLPNMHKIPVLIGIERKNESEGRFPAKYYAFMKQTKLGL